MSHAPRRHQAFLMMVDSFSPLGITQIAVDSIFMMPQLGVLSSIHPEAALEVFDRDCLVRLGTSINPIIKNKSGEFELFSYAFSYNNKDYNGVIKSNDLELLEIPYEPIDLTLTPKSNVDLGSGFGQKINKTVYGGEVGILFDGRINNIKGQSISQDKNKIKEYYNKTKVYSL